MEEAQLLSMLKQDQDSAFRELYRLYKDRVYNTALSMLQHEQEAEDAAQETFVEVFRALPSFRAEAKLSTWIYRICVNKTLEMMRHHKRKRRWARVVSIFQPDTGEYLVEPADFRHPGVQLEQQEQATELFKGMDKLPENQKTAFVLHHIEGVSYKEIAEIMQTSLASVESLMFRAKRNMMKYLEAYHHESK